MAGEYLRMFTKSKEVNGFTASGAVTDINSNPLPDKAEETRSAPVCQAMENPRGLRSVNRNLGSSSSSRKSGRTTSISFVLFSRLSTADTTATITSPDRSQLNPQSLKGCVESQAQNKFSDISKLNWTAGTVPFSDDTLIATASP